MSHHSTLKRVIVGGGGILSTQFFVKALGFLFILLLARFLGAAEYGIFALAFSVSHIGKKIATLGLPTTVSKYFSGKGSKNIEEIFGSIIVVAIVSSITWGLIILLFSNFIAVYFFSNAALAETIKILSLYIIIGAPFLVLIAILRAKEKVRALFYFEVFSTVLRVLSVAIILFFIREATAVAWAIVVAQGIALTVLISYFSKINLRSSFRNLRHTTGKVLQYSLPLLFVGLGFFLAQQIDRIMIGIFLPSKEVGIYSAVSSLALITSTIYTSFMYIFMPIASEAFRNKNNEEWEQAYTFLSKWMGILTGIILIIFAGWGLFILHIFGAEYANHTSYTMLLILTMLYFLGGCAGPTGALMQMTDKHYVELFNTIVFIALNIILNIIFIQSMGIVGAAIATLVSGTAWRMMQGFEIGFLYKLNILNSDNLAVILIVITGVLGCYFFHEYRLLFFIFSLASLVFHAFFTLKQEEKELIAKFKTRFAR